MGALWQVVMMLGGCGVVGFVDGSHNDEGQLQTFAIRDRCEPTTTRTSPGS